MFVVPENMHEEFMSTYLYPLVDEGHLHRIIFDECHTLVLDKWRPSMQVAMELLRPLKVQKVWMSAMLPAHVLQQLCTAMSINIDHCQHI